jgi:hypothetical protein
MEIVNKDILGFSQNTIHIALYYHISIYFIIFILLDRMGSESSANNNQFNTAMEERPISEAAASKVQVSPLISIE